MVGRLRPLHCRRAASLLHVPVGCCHFIHSSLFDCYSVSTGKQPSRSTKRRSSLVEQGVERVEHERVVLLLYHLAHNSFLPLVRCDCPLTTHASLGVAPRFHRRGRGRRRRVP